MAQYGLDYTWEAHEVKTNDGYLLTMFRIIGDETGASLPDQGSKGPLLIQHGFMTDSISWFDISDSTRPALPVRLFQEGFDVWLGNNRGTMNSRRHVDLDADEDAWSYWDFSHHEFAAFDVPQMTAKIAQVNKTCHKISVLGHSVGSMQMFYALGRSSYMRPYFAQIVALSPCFIPGSKNYVENLTSEVYTTLSGIFTMLDIESMFGPNWPSQLNGLCAVLGKDSEECIMLKNIPVGPLAGGDIRGYSEIGAQQLKHLGQLAMTGRFQYYQEAFVIERAFGIKGKLIHVDRIDEPPIKFLYIDGDDTCPIDVQKPYAESIPSAKSHYTIYGRTHNYVVGDNDDEFFKLVVENLSDHQHILSPDDCSKLMGD